MTRKSKGEFIAMGMSALLMAGVATAAHAATSAATIPASVLVKSQKLEDGHVFVEYAYLPVNGYAVVYGADKDGKPIREALGSVELAAGDHRKFKIKIDKAAPAGSTLWVSLYTDNDGKPGFDRSGDTAVWQDRLPAENKITVE